jgi:hypothetical protein
MIEKQLKVHAAPKAEGGARAAREEAVAMLFRTPDMATVLNNQRHAVEAITAATEKLLEGVSTISKKQLALQNTLMQQAFRNTLDYLKPEGERSETRTSEVVEASTETTLEAMRDIAQTALKCNMEALNAFSDRIRRMEAPRPGSERPHTAQAAE